MTKQINQNDYINVGLTCPWCGHDHSVQVVADDYRDWVLGLHAQDAFPYLDAVQREQLISRLCPDCQAKFFRATDIKEVTA